MLFGIVVNTAVPFLNFSFSFFFFIVAGRTGLSLSCFLYDPICVLKDEFGSEVILLLLRSICCWIVIVLSLCETIGISSSLMFALISSLQGKQHRWCYIYKYDERGKKRHFRLLIITGILSYISYKTLRGLYLIIS